MWKQDAGDWRERRQRRGLPRDLPEVLLPPPHAAPHGGPSAFVGGNFADRGGGEAALRAPLPGPPKTPPTAAGPPGEGGEAARRWVVVRGGVGPSRVHVRAFFEARFGRVLAALPPPSSGAPSPRGRGELYVGFEDPAVAAVVVHGGSYHIEIERGAACTAGADLLSANRQDSAPVQQMVYIEVSVAWCADWEFLRRMDAIEKARWEWQQRYYLDPPYRDPSAENNPSTAVARSSFPFSLLNKNVVSNPTSPSERRGEVCEARGSANPQRISDLLDDKRKNIKTTNNSGHRNGDNYHGWLLLLTAFVNGNVWLELLRLVVMIGWMLLNIVRTLVEGSYASLSLRNIATSNPKSCNNDWMCQVGPEKGTDYENPAAFTRSSPSPPAAHYPEEIRKGFQDRGEYNKNHTSSNAFHSASRRRTGSRRSRARSMASPSNEQNEMKRSRSCWNLFAFNHRGNTPFDYLANLLSSFIPYAPNIEKVDLFLWSCLQMRSLFVQHKVETVRQRLQQQRIRESSSFSWIPRSENALNRYRSSSSYQRGGSYALNNVDYGYDSYFTKGSEPYSRNLSKGSDSFHPNDNHHDDGDGERRLRRAQYPLVLWCWRPSWWFTRYSILSTLLIIFVVIKLYMIPFIWRSPITATRGDSLLIG